LHASARVKHGGASLPSSEGKAALQIRYPQGSGADVFSLGMLLVALLTREPALGRNFRDQLGNIVRTLLDRRLFGETWVSGRELVRWLRLTKAAVLNPFFELERRLDEYGSVRFLAEELLGIALRCALRGASPPCYLPERNADAAAALKRLRFNFERVRRAFRIFQAVVSGEAEVAERQRRLAALVDWVAGQNAQVPPRAVPRPKLESQRALLEETLLLLHSAVPLPPSDPEAVTLLESYGYHTDWLQGHLGDLSGSMERGQVGTITTDQALIVDLVRYAYPFDLSSATVERLKEAWQLPMGSVQPVPQGLEGVAAWKKEHDDLHGRLVRFTAALATLEAFVKRLNWLFFEELANGLESGKNPVVVSLDRGARETVKESEASAAVTELEACRQFASERYRHQAARIRKTLEDWRQLSSPIQEALLARERFALTQEAELRQRQQEWQKMYKLFVGRLRRFLEELSAGPLGAWDAVLHKGVGLLKRWFGDTNQVCVKFTKQHLKVIRWKPDTQLQELRKIGLGPAAALEAALALDALEAIRQSVGIAIQMRV
jgi:hypothetical protein